MIPVIMDPRLQPAGMTTEWRILSTPPTSGDENMRIDELALEGVGKGLMPATIRFFRFSEPTVTYGRLQKWPLIQPLVPEGWPAARRPTGGGMVIHDNDLCLSLCWPRGQAPLPIDLREQYLWIHSVILEAMGDRLRLATCQDAVCGQESPFEVRNCFTNPVGYDVMKGDQKVVGGALACQNRSILYQGSIQIRDPAVQARICSSFEKRLS